MLRIAFPIQPHRGLRGTDSFGSGNFGASRGSRDHKGLDFIALVGDVVVAPITGSVVQIGRAYGDAELHSVHIQGDGEFTGCRVKLLYVLPNVGLNGRYVNQGDPIGTAEDVAAYHHAKQPGHPGEMKNHVHVEVWITEPRPMDPAMMLPPVPPAGLTA